MCKPGKNEIKTVASLFATDAPVNSVRAFGNGLINDTYIAETESGKRYILQRVNRNVFTDMDILQDNLYKITAHMRRCLQEKGVEDIERRVLTPITAADGTRWVEAYGQAWRMTLFIEGSQSFENLTAEMAELTGEAFAAFHTYFARDDAPMLKETIADFHNTGFRINQLLKAKAENRALRLSSCVVEADTLLARADEMLLAQKLYDAGKLKKRITHCDTKLNNILFDSDSSILCVIDLDTTMPGFVLSDFGDFIRSAANKGQEDDRNLDRVEVDMDIFRNFARGYVRKAVFLTDTEKILLPFGAKMLTYMQAVRFLTDYLNGDTYYKTTSADHNLVRTRAQMKLLKSIDSHYEDMVEYIQQL